MNKIIIFSFLFGILSGFRQDLSYIFLPLFLFLLYKVKNFYLIIKSIIMFGLICLIWFIPLIIEYGGISSYLYILKNQKCVYETSLIIKGISLRPLINILRVLFYIFNSLFFVFPIFIYKIYKNDNLNIEKKFLIILLFSLIPALIFNLFIHMGNYTLIGSFIIPLFIYLIYNFKINNLKKIIFIIILTLFPLIQFYNIKLIKEPKNIIEKVINVIFLQYSFDGIKSKNELALQSIYIPERK